MRARFRLVVALLILASHVLCADVLYKVTDLGTLGGATSGYGINNLGQVVGDSLTYTGAGYSDRAFLYTNGQMTDLGTLPGNSFASRGDAINNAGQVVGSSTSNVSKFWSYSHAFLYGSGKMTDLGMLPGDLSSGGLGFYYVGGLPSAEIGRGGINNAGQVVGTSYTISPFDGSYSSRAFLYSNGKMTDLGTLPGDSRSLAGAINDIGQIVGGSADASNQLHAFIYSNGEMMALGTLPGESASVATSINNAGQVTGIAYSYSNSVGGAIGAAHAFLYTDGQMIDLGTLTGYSSSEGLAINSAGQVVGSSGTGFLASNPHAFLYSNGQMRDLNDLIDPALGISLSVATAINDNGQIVANGGANRSGASRVFLLTPTSEAPEPGTLALLGVSSLVLVACSRRRRNSVH